MSVLQAYARRRVVITGGMGFIGSNLARRLVELGAEVTVLDNQLRGQGANPTNLCGIPERWVNRLRLHALDLRDESRLAAALEGAEVVFNLAAQTGHIDSMRDPVTDMENNCRAQIALLEMCRRVIPTARVIYTSTRQVYGRTTSGPVDELRLPNPVDVNGIHKLAAEGYHRVYYSAYGLPTCCLRLTNTFGPRMRVRDANQSFLGLWIRLVLEGQEFEVWGGRQLRDFSYVDDVTQALLLAGSHAAAVGRTFNLGGDRAIHLIDLAALLIEVAEAGAYRVKELPDERRRIDIGDYVTDDSEFRTTCGWSPQVPLKEGLSRTLAYYRTHLQEYV